MATPPVFSVGQVLTSAVMNQAGLWKIASGDLSSTSTNFASCFTDDYRNYRIIISNIAMNATGVLYFRMLSGTTAQTGSDYFWAFNGLTVTGTNSPSSNQSQTVGYLGANFTGVNNLAVGAVSIDIINPKIAARTVLNTHATSVDTNFLARVGLSVHNVATAYDGIQFLTNTATTMTGKVVIYGYRD